MTDISTEDRVATLHASMDDMAKLVGQQRQTISELREALGGLLSDIEDLMGESAGVYGLHLNGDPSPWDELDEGGRFERLTHLSQARKALKPTGEAT